ncbi:hypothetical protein [Hansschlegelia beijingensis]|uniref:SGNH/GDSL hydrolase family protein n=1 Tax=Hansschlegelia beijingensis TaxID=1133344 RepID=A0A7W6GF74_9HYPH|nr:hypothetical protein [Hansschlegelia beijingensis]MBB3972632.1 hypothetical protein [Hansschlegelia beijingensis]
MRVLIAGDSHTRAYRTALERSPRPNMIATMLGSGSGTKRPFFVREGVEVRFAADPYRSAWSQASGRDDILPREGETLALVMGFHSAPNFRHRDWTAFAPAELAAGNGAIPISAAVQDAVALKGGGHTRRFVETLVDAWRDREGSRDAPIFVLSAPPPYRGHSIIRRAKAKPEVVIAAHRRFVESAREFFRGLGVEVIDYPAASTDDEGFLLPEFREGISPQDPHHANSRFADIMMDQLELRLRGSSTTS